MLCTPRRPLHLPAILSLRKFFVSIRCRNEIFTYLCNISSRNCKTSKHYVTIQPIPLDIHGRRAARASAPHTPRRTRHGRHDLLWACRSSHAQSPFCRGIEGAGHQLFVPQRTTPRKSIDDYLHKLSKLGIEATREEDVQPRRWPRSTTSRPTCRRHAVCSSWGTPSMISEFEKAGFVSTGDDPTMYPTQS